MLKKYTMINKATDEDIGTTEVYGGCQVGDEIWKPHGIYRVVDILDDKLFVIKVRNA